MLHPFGSHNHTCPLVALGIEYGGGFKSPISVAHKPQPRTYLSLNPVFKQKRRLYIPKHTPSLARRVSMFLILEWVPMPLLPILLLFAVGFISRAVG
jgi:hypothetical protein